MKEFSFEDLMKKVNIGFSINYVENLQKDASNLKTE
jgi:hypothetical protein